MAARRYPTQRVRPVAHIDAAYIRVSDGRQNEERQHADLEDDQERHGFTFSGRIFTDRVSASTKTTKYRADFEAIMAEIRSGRLNGKVLWFAEFSRSTRNLKVYFAQVRELAMAHDVRFFISTDGKAFDLNIDTDREIVDKKAFDAESEINQLSRRAKSGVRAMVKKGRPHGRIPYGYQRVYDENTGKPIGQVMHPEHGPIVQEIAKRFAGGESTAAIAADLNARGITPPHNAMSKRSTFEANLWHASDIGKRAVNPVYIGKRVYDGQQTEALPDGIYDGMWPAIIDEVIHSAAVERHSGAARFRGADNVFHFLSGVATCELCRKAGVYDDPATARKGYVHARPRVNGRTVYTCRAGCFAIGEDIVDAYVLAELTRVIEAGDWRGVTDVDTSADVERLRLQMDAHKRRERSLTAMLLTVDDPETLTAPLNETARAIRDVERELDRLTEIAPALRWIATEDPMLTFASLSMSRRKAVVRELIAVECRPLGRGRRGWTVDRSFPVHEVVVVTPRF